MANRTPKKVLLVIRWPVGGIRTFVRYVYRNFDPCHWRFTIVAPVHFEMEAMLKDLADNDIRYISVEERPSLAGFFFRVVIEVLRGGYDIVHSHGFTAGMSAALPAFICQTPHMITSHETMNAGQFVGVKGRIKRWSMTTLFGTIDRIHSVSHDAQANLLEYFPVLIKHKSKCVVIRNGIEVERFTSANTRNLHEELAVRDDVFLIGFIGRFMKPKGFHFLAEAVGLLQQRENLPRPFLVITFGGGGFIREERKAIEEKGLEAFFRFMPFTHNVAGAIKGLDVVAMPSLWEACPLLAMETLTCGTPLIGSDCIGLREVLRNTPALIVKPRDGKGLADAIVREMRNPSKRDHAAFVEEAVKRFDVKNQSRELCHLYKKLLNLNIFGASTVNDSK